MTTKTRIVYKGAIKNKEFLSDIFMADGDKKPGLFSSGVDKTIFATIYYGWLVGKYGEQWEQHI